MSTPRKRIKVSNNFFLDEFIHPEIYAARGARSIELIDPRMILLAQFIRTGIGKSITINNWFSGGKRVNSGLRTFTGTVGATWSQHRYGNAIDIQVAGITPEEVHEFLFKHEKTLIEKGWLTTLEHLDDTPTWSHLDNRYTGRSEFWIVRK